MVYTDIYIGPANNVENKKGKLQTLSELKMHTADEQCNHGLSFLQDELDRAFYDKNSCIFQRILMYPLNGQANVSTNI